MKKSFLAWFILSMTSSSAFAASVPTSKTELAEKIRSANAAIPRSHIECASKTELKNVLSTETATSSDLDTSNSIMHIVTEVKTFALNLQDLFRAQAEKSITEEKGKGASAEKIAKMQKLTESLSSGMDRMLGSIKGKKFDMYLSGNDLYILLKSGWVKSEASGNNPAGVGLVQQANFPTMLAKGKTPGSLCGTIGLDNLLQSISSVSEGDCAGKACYVLDINTEGLGPILTQMLMASQTPGKDKNMRAAVTSLAITLSVDKDTYVMLSSTANAAIVLYDPIRPGYSLHQAVEEHTTYAYPADQLVLPAELSQAMIVNDKEQLRKMITDEIGGGDFKAGIKNVQ